MKTTTAVILLFLVSVAVSREQPEHPTRKFTRIVNYVYDAYNKFKNFSRNGLFGSEIKYQEKTNPPGDTATNPPDGAENNPLDDTEQNPPNDTETNDGLDDSSLTETTTPKQDWRKSTHEEPEHPTRKFHKIVNYVNDAYNKFKNFFWNGNGSEIKYQEKTNPPGDTATNPLDDPETNDVLGRRRTTQTPGLRFCSRNRREPVTEVCFPVFFKSNGNRNRM